MLNSTGSPGITARTVKPGGTGQSTFSFTPGGVGEYVIRNITVRYSENISGSASNISTIHPFVIHVPPPQFLYAFNRVEATSLSALGKSVGFPYLAAEIMPGIYVFDLLAALVVGTDIMIEVRTFRSYRSGRN